jgi:hypothetical protein
MTEPNDPVLQTTCNDIVTLIAEAIDREPAGNRQAMSLPGGGVIGQQITIDAAEEGKMNRCRFSILDVNQSPAGEVARIEYVHDKQGKFEVRRVYSIQSVRRQAGGLTLLENFLALGPDSVREEDFRPIRSEAYAQTVVLKAVRDWAHWRQWQLQEGHAK